MNVHEFVAKWQRSTLKERSASQEHFLNLCALLGHPSPADIDPDGTEFTFERGAKKLGGGEGWADVWKRGCFAWEYKGKHKNLETAYLQLQRYRDDLENPPLLVVCDFSTFEIRTNFTGTLSVLHRVTLADLHRPEKLDLLRRVFFDPESLRPGRDSSPVTTEAAAAFAVLADMLRARGVEAHRAAHFLTKLIFCLFAEDVSLLPKGLFARIVARTASDPPLFSRYLRDLFEAMAKGGNVLLEPIDRFNGNLFDDAEVIDLTEGEIAAVRKASDFDWSNIEPAIFGTLFERSLDPGKRAQIGAHYTHPDDIRALVEPVLMAPLRREWEEVRERGQEVAQQRTDAVAALGAGASGAAVRAKARPFTERLTKLLTDFHHRLAEVRVLDPACGSGNFLYVSLNLLKDLEREVMTFAGEVGVSGVLPLVSPSQLYGIEINTYAYELAQMAIWIGFIQWQQAYGYQVGRDPVLQSLTTITNRDAILEDRDPANIREPEWPAADVIVGNPPFLGSQLLRGGLGNEYVERLFALYEGRVANGSDLVCYWFEKARAALMAGHVKRVGLIATQGVRGGTNRRTLERIKESGDIFFAYSDRNWINEGATVHVSMIGFDNGTETERRLDDRPVEDIHADLTSGYNLTLARQLPENASVAYIGDMKKGKFDVVRSVAAQWLSDRGNPNGAFNRVVVRPWMNGLDVTSRPREMWIVDFPIDMPEKEASEYQRPFEYVREHVLPARAEVRNELERRRWWVHGRTGPDMRAALSPLRRYAAVVRVAKHRLWVHVSPWVIPDGQLVAVAREDDYAFGVLHSRAHDLWALRMGTQLESRPRYTPTTCFETFPFPWPLNTPDAALTPEQAAHRDAIAAAARDLDAKRNAWLNPPDLVTWEPDLLPELPLRPVAKDEDAAKELAKRTLTNLYNQRPTWLDLLHRALDAAVFAAYGWPADLTDDEVLERLLALNLERASG